MKRNTQPGFSLIELLFVLSIVALISALLFPVFAQSRARARASSCSANLRQLGMAVAMYSQDYDNVYPFGLDPVDKFTDAWKGNAAFKALLASAPTIQEVTLPYTKSPRLWQCPSDIGFDKLEHSFDAQSTPLAFDARPSCFDKYGTSYFYRTSLAFDRQTYGSITGHYQFQREEIYDTAEIDILFDGNGTWHGGFGKRRYNCLMGDGHIRNLDSERYDRLKQVIVD